MKYIKRKLDTITQSDNLENLHTITNFPILMDCVDHDISDDIFVDMTWQIGADSGIIQLRDLIPLDVLYASRHGAGSVGKLWASHHKQFAKFIQKFNPSSVLEIGGGHGILAKECNELAPCNWLIVEPDPVPVENCPATFIKGIFDESFVCPYEIDTVIHSHLFEHIYDPSEFMQHLSNLIKAGQNLIFSIPNLFSMLRKKHTNCINFEHTIFLTEPYVDFLLSKYGFRVLTKEYFLDDHSIFYAAIREPNVIPTELQHNLYDTNKKIYEEYVSYHAKLIEEFNNAMKHISAPIYLFGAHIFSQYLIKCGLDTSKIIGLLDNDPTKHGKRLYGTGLTVFSPEILRDVNTPVVILKTGFYNDEIKNAIVTNINTHTIFLE